MNDETRAGLHRLKSGWLKADLFRGRSLRKKTRTIEQGFCQQHPSRQWMDPRHNYACSSKRPRCSTTRHQLFIRWSSARAAETLCKRGISTILHIVERKAPLVNSVSSFEITSPISCSYVLSELRDREKGRGVSPANGWRLNCMSPFFPRESTPSHHSAAWSARSGLNSFDDH